MIEERKKKKAKIKDKLCPNKGHSYHTRKQLHRETIQQLIHYQKRFSTVNS